MKKVLKWILGILIGLVVIAVVLGAGYMVARRARTVMWMRESRLAQRGDVEQGAPWQTKPRQRNQGENKPGQKWPRNFGRNDMPMRYYGGMGFHPFGGLRLVGRLVGGVFRLAILGLVIFLAVTLALRQKQVKKSLPANAAQPAAELTEAAGMACPHCAREIQADWKHCPHCGNSLDPSQPDVPLT
jgi:hypothetical protein